MNVLERIRKWRPGGPNDAPEGLVRADKLAAKARREGTAAPATDRERELLAQRDRLSERFTMMQADLGGVFYEMAIRDHVRMDVLTRKAAELQRVDAELVAVERELRGDGPAVGACPSCRTPHGEEARFCSSCGHALPGGRAAVINRIAHTNGSAGPGS